MRDDVSTDHQRNHRQYHNKNDPCDHRLFHQMMNTPPMANAKIRSRNSITNPRSVGVNQTSWLSLKGNLLNPTIREYAKRFTGTAHVHLKGLHTELVLNKLRCSSYTNKFRSLRGVSFMQRLTLLEKLTGNSLR